MTYHDAWITSPAGVPDLASQLGITYDPEVRPAAFLPSAYEAFFVIRDGVQRGTFPGVQVDWGSWAAVLNHDQLAAFVDKLFGPPGAYEADQESFPRLMEKMRDVRAAIDAMPPDGRAAVVVEEF